MMRVDKKEVKMKFQIMPPKPGTCPECAVKHPPEYPHDAHSLFYQYKFYGEHGRWPTWVDAMAHCSDEIKDATMDVLKKKGMKVNA